MKYTTNSRNFLIMKGITWKITTLRAPWRSGVYERLIGLTKNATRRRLFWEKELTTLMEEIEGTLNTRPSTRVNSEEYVILRPVDFISSCASLITQISFDDD
uniref:Gag-pol polyprotein n=1 Tax=Onchocerca flexuosa TaxID=387005 RepID=A0A183HLT2_9BILA